MARSERTNRTDARVGPAPSSSRRGRAGGLGVLSGRAARLALGLASAAGVLAFASGCVVQPRVAGVAAHAQLEDERASANATLFSTQPVATAMADVNPYRLPEYGRRDQALSVSVPRALTAADQWPEPEGTSILDPRYIYLHSFGRDTYLLFTNDRHRRWR